MTPVFQDRFGGPDAPWEEQGNCHAACLASIFDVSLDEVPEPTEENWYEPHFEWLGEQGYQTWWHDVGYEHPIQPGDEFNLDLSALGYEPHRYLMLGGKSPRGDFGHVIVFDTETNTVVHDPHPSGDGILDVEDIQTFARVS